MKSWIKLIRKRKMKKYDKLEYKVICIIRIIFSYILFIKRFNFFQIIYIYFWGLGIGDWGLGIGDLAPSPIPNPPSPIS